MYPEEETLSVSELTSRVAQHLEYIGMVWVEGEVSKMTRHSSQHWYFDIGDERAVLSCVMFRGYNLSMTWAPKKGDKIKVFGEINVFARRGAYNICVTRMEKAGLGVQLQKLQELRQKLMAEGLFDAHRKRPLPRLPRCVGVATASTGAAFQDIREVLHARYPNLRIVLASCFVQGENAPESIVSAIELLNRYGQCDLIIVGRGGGSTEDLMAFNDERVVRAVANSQVPTICAVGHEVDHSLADLAADRRAATPSHAAEVAVPVKAELLLRIQQLERRLSNAVWNKLRLCQQQLNALKPKDPRQRIVEGRMRCDELMVRLERSVQHLLLQKISQQRRMMAQLDALSPLAVLSRGYALASQKSGSAITDSYQLRTGELIHVRFEKGEITAKVQEIFEQAEQLKLL